MKRKWPYLWLSGVLVGLFLLPVAASPTPLRAVLRYLPLGWWHFLQRNIPKMTYNWGLIATGLICSALVIGLGTWLLRALFSQIQQASHPDQPVRLWPWRWTVCIYATVCLLFTIAFGAAGVLRHTSWLLAYYEPWYQERMNPYIALAIADGAVQELMLENDQDLQTTRRAFQRQRSERRGPALMCEEFEVIFYGDGSNKVAAYLVIPRGPRLTEKGGFRASLPGANDRVRPISELQRTIADLDAAFPPNGSN